MNLRVNMLLFEIVFLHHCFNRLFSQIEKYCDNIRLCTEKAKLMVKLNVMAWIWLGWRQHKLNIGNPEVLICSDSQAGHFEVNNFLGLI